MSSANLEAQFIVVGALDQELAPLRARSLSNLLFLKTGVGTENASGALRRGLQRTSPQAVLGIGYAGGLSPQLRVGDLVVARCIMGSLPSVISADLLRAAECIRVEGPAVYFGTILTVNEVIGTSMHKKSLAASLPPREVGCVDMESSAIALVCSEFRLPFLIVRCVTDTLDEDLPIDFNSCRKSDGTIDSKRVLLSSFSSLRAFAGLWQLHKRSKHCAENLARFMENLVQSDGLAAVRSLPVEDKRGPRQA
jgi:adenosylhomocysteine nucleosidase